MATLFQIYLSPSTSRWKVHSLSQIGEDGREAQPSPLEFYAESDRWFKNLGDGTFEMQSIPEKMRDRNSLGLIITNFDNQLGNEICWQ